MDLKAVSGEWDQAAGVFDQQPDHGMFDPVTRAAWWTLLKSLLPAAPARVADLGCGTGTVSVLLAQQGYDVIGLDLSPKMIELARDKAYSAGLPIKLEVGNAAEPDLDAGAYDVVFARHVVWALPEPEVAMQRWVGLLAPAGRLVLVEGRWHTGAGLTADSLYALVAPLVRQIDVLPLANPDLWGGLINDERYALCAYP